MVGINPDNEEGTIYEKSVHTTIVCIKSKLVINCILCKFTTLESKPILFVCFFPEYSMCLLRLLILLLHFKSTFVRVLL